MACSWVHSWYSTLPSAPLVVLVDLPEAEGAEEGVGGTLLLVWWRWHPGGLPSSSINALGSALGSLSPGPSSVHVLHSCALLSSSVGGIEVLRAWGLGLSSSAPCPGHCAGPPGISCSLMPPPPHAYLAVNLAHAICHQETSHPFQPQGRGMQGENSHMEGAGGHVCPTPASPETKPRIPLTTSSFVPSSPSDPPGVRTVWGPGAGRGAGRERGHGNCTPTASYLTGVLFRDALGQQVQILPQSRN